MKLIENFIFCVVNFSQLHIRLHKTFCMMQWLISCWFCGLYRYDFAFYPAATLKKLADIFPNFTIGPNFVRDMEEEATCLLNTIYAGKHVYPVEQMLGQGKKRQLYSSK